MISPSRATRFGPASPLTTVPAHDYRRTVTYADSGISIHAGAEAVEQLRTKVHRTWRPEVVEDNGGFAGLFRLDLQRYRRPLLASSTDGVGPKLHIAQQMDVHDTVGVDLVAMVVDDLVACGAEPLFLLNYIACGEVVPERVAAIAAGIADGCRAAGCSLLGGETAEHQGVLRPHEYDMSATGIGVVEEDKLLGAARVEVGDAIIAMGSSGLHANGYSLVQHTLLGISRMRLDIGHRGVRESAHARAGTSHADSHLRQGLPRSPDRGGRTGAGAHYRRRHHGQPGPGDAGERRRDRRPGHVAAAAHLRTGSAQGSHRTVRNGVNVQHGRRHDGRRQRRGQRAYASRSCAAVASTPGWPAKWWTEPETSPWSVRTPAVDPPARPNPQAH